MLVEENVLTPPKHPKVAQKYLDLVTMQAIKDVQFSFHVHQTILSQVLEHYHADTQQPLQGTMFEPLGSHGLSDSQ